MRSDASEMEYSPMHSGMSLRRLQSHRSYDDHSPQQSLSDAGTMIVRGSTAFSGNYSMDMLSPSLHSMHSIPIQIDMHADLNALIAKFQSAESANNAKYDDLHEELVEITSNWDRVRSEKELKYLNAKGNYCDYVVLDLLAVLNAQLGKTEIAVKYHLDSIKRSNGEYIEAMHNIAYLLHRMGEFADSRRYFEQALNINPHFAHCWLHFGNLLEDESKNEAAAKCYKKAISLRPNKAAFHLDLANLLDDMDAFADASKEYLRCIELSPNDAVYHWNYAISLENQCFYHRAEEAYKRAIALDAECLDARINFAHLLCNLPIPKFRQALREYIHLLKQPAMAQNTDIMLKCAKLHAHFDEDDEAELLFMNVLQIDPAMEECYILFANHLTNKNRIEDANACYQAGIRHVQSAKLQGKYIAFLQDINNVYNKPQSKNKAPVFHKKASSRNIPPSPFVSQTKPIYVKKENNVKKVASAEDPGCIVM